MNEREKGFYYAIREGEKVIAEWDGGAWWLRADMLCTTDFEDIGFKINLGPPEPEYKRVRLSKMNPGEQFAFTWNGTRDNNIIYCMLKPTDANTYANTDVRYRYYIVNGPMAFTSCQTCDDLNPILIENGLPCLVV